ncbi:MAG: ribonuclease J [Pseudomonadales bacterium]|nr:ribonuclease J [Pseudomonadales bacterium]
MTPGHDELWFLPLGGTGEIGMNLNLYGHAGQWLMVDCGVTFAREGEPGPHVQMADPGFIVERRDALTALLVTHAHEDHVGAVAHLWPRLRCPLYTTRFTAEVLRRKLAEHGLLDAVPLHVIETGDRIALGAFEVEWLAITHSIPEAHGLVLRTPAATVLHTGDWKLDPGPVLGPAFDAERFRALGRAGVDAMVCDSTNALEAGHSRSEAELHAGLRECVASAPGRVVVTSFGSNVARLHTLARVARETGRYMTVLGRSLRNMVAAARAAGIWAPEGTLVDSREIGYLPRQEILMVATGSQGDPHAAMDRLSRGTHPDVELDAGDRALFSSRVIPGNERTLEALTERLRQRGVEIVTAEDALIHASGHPCEDELRAMYEWVRPGIAVPTHGTERHMQAHARLAARVGVPRQLTGRNGDLFLLAPQAGVRRGVATVGRLGVGERGLERIASPSAASAVPSARTAPAIRTGA